jgi:hypothetical protein
VEIVEKKFMVIRLRKERNGVKAEKPLWRLADPAWPRLDS